MNTTAKPNITVHVVSEFLEEESSPEAKEYVFRYHVTVCNHTTESFKLISRFWKVQDHNEQTQEIQGQGVLGKQPNIEAGDNHTYDSLVMLEAPLGTMEGKFTFRDTHGDYHDIVIEPFMLARPNQLH